MRTVRCTTGCCEITCCPLVLAWALTIHKFQGFEAGFGPNDAVKHLLVDPGCLSFEHQNLGLLYVAISRAKTIGDVSLGSMNHGSNIYWIGSNMCQSRVTEIGRTKTGMCEVFKQRKLWTEYLEKRKNWTRGVYDEKTLRNLERSYESVTRCPRMGREELVRRIQCAIMSPNYEINPSDQVPVAAL